MRLFSRRIPKTTQREYIQIDNADEIGLVDIYRHKDFKNTLPYEIFMQAS